MVGRNLRALGGQARRDDMKNKNSRIGLACELLKLVGAVLSVAHALMQLIGPAINYRRAHAKIL
jgi:hypothetical protein